MARRLGRFLGSWHSWYNCLVFSVSRWGPDMITTTPAGQPYGIYQTLQRMLTNCQARGADMTDMTASGGLGARQKCLPRGKPACVTSTTIDHLHHPAQSRNAHVSLLSRRCSRLFFLWPCTVSNPPTTCISAKPVPPHVQHSVTSAPTA